MIRLAASLVWLWLGLLWFGLTPGLAEGGLDWHRLPPDFVKITPGDGITVDLRYAGVDNFTHSNIYGDYKDLYLHRIAAEKLHKAVELLQQEHRGYRLIVFDGLRPSSFQRVLFDAAPKGPSRTAYVANPATHSIHSYGLAVDVSILDETGKALDMGTGFDDFRPLAQPRFEKAFLAKGELGAEALKNRLLLRSVMQEAGFQPIVTEWWHFDALPPAYVRQHFQVVE